MSWETLAAGQQLARELQQPVSAAVLGQGIEGLAAELAGQEARACLCRRARASQRLYAGRLYGGREAS